MEGEDILHQRLLDKLNEYGDSLLDNEEYAKTKSKPTKLKNGRHSTQNFDNQLAKTATNSSNLSALSTKKKKKKNGNVAERNDETSNQRTTGRGQFADFEEELRQYKLEVLEKKQMSQEEKETVKRSAPEVIVFEDPSRRKKRKVENHTENIPKQEEFNLKKVRHEVRQFGLSGFSYEDREKCEADRAVSLGAWAPKKEYINYKEYTELQKKKKEEERQQREIDRKMGYSVKNKPAEKTRVRNQGFWRDPTQDKKFFLDGQVGRYKQGVQVVSKDDVTMVKARARKRHRGGKSNKIKF